MLRFLHTNLLRLLACTVLLAPALHAAELGDVAARSYVGQPLSADVELLGGDGATVQARLAQPDVYRGANITMNPALSSVKMAVVKRDNKDYLHVTTTGAVNADYVHVYVELNAGGRRDIRLATVWLQPDPNPAPPPAPAVVASAVAAPAAAAVTAPAAAPVSAPPIAGLAKTTPAGAPPAVLPARERTRPTPTPAAPTAARAAGGSSAAPAAQARPASVVSVRDIPERVSEALGATRAGSASASAVPAQVNKPAVTPPAEPVSAASKPAALASAKPDAAVAAAPAKPAAVASNATSAPAAKPAAVAGKPADVAPPLPVAQALLPMPPLPLPAGVKRAAAPAVCAPVGATASECKALDVQSQALSAKLVELEGRVKQLQGALAGSSGAAAAVQVAKDAAPVAATAAVAAAAATPAPSVAPAAASAAPAAGEAKAATVADQPAAPPADKPAVAQPAAADAAASASAPAAEPVPAAPPVQQRRVLPKLKYKKEKSPEEHSSNLPLILGLGGLGAAVLGGGAWLYWRRKKSGAGPLKIWQGFRKKQGPILTVGDEFKEVPAPKVPVPEPAVPA
jgi:pilus assembly protein FimV